MQRDSVKKEMASKIKLQYHAVTEAKEKGKQIIKWGNSQEVGRIKKWNMCDSFYNYPPIYLH